MAQSREPGAGSGFGEVFVPNTFQTRYVPIANPSQFAQSGFIGENGRPRTFGMSFGVTF